MPPRQKQNRPTPTLRLERLEERIALSVNVSGELFWDANRNGLRDDPPVAHESVSVFVEYDAGSVTLSGMQASYGVSGVEDESNPNFTNPRYNVADVRANAGSGYEVTNLLESRLKGQPVSYETIPGVFSTQPLWLEAADLDGMNGPDLIVTNKNQQVMTIFLNDGSGGFANRHEVAVPREATSVDVADFDADGDPDLLVGTLSQSDPPILLVNDGTGTFAGPGARHPLPVAGQGAFSVVAADVNADGRPDLIANTIWDQQLSVYLNQSTGGQLSFGLPTTIDAGSGSKSIVAANLTGQPGLPSIVAIDDLRDELVVFSNDGSGGFTPTAVFDARGSRVIAAGRIDADPYDDIVMYQPYDGTIGPNPELQKIYVLFGDGAGGFDPVAADPRTEWYPRGVAIADMDGDGDNDIVANLIDGFDPAILRNDGDRRIADALPVFENPLDPPVSSPPALADFNRDGVVDIAHAPVWFGGTVEVRFQELVPAGQVVRTDNDGASFTGRDFGIARVVTPAQTAAGDFDGDGQVGPLDYAVWSANYGRTAGPGMSADANGDGVVNAIDYTIWRDNEGASFSLALAQAPEPAAPAATLSPEGLAGAEPVVSPQPSWVFGLAVQAPAPEYGDSSPPGGINAPSAAAALDLAVLLLYTAHVSPGDQPGDMAEPLSTPGPTSEESASDARGESQLTGGPVGHEWPAV